MKKVSERSLKMDIEKLNTEIASLKEMVMKLMNYVYYGNGNSLIEEMAELRVKMSEFEKLISDNRKFMSRMMVVFWGTLISFVGSLIIFLFNVLVR